MLSSISFAENCNSTCPDFIHKNSEKRGKEREKGEAEVQNGARALENDNVKANFLRGTFQIGNRI